MKEVSYMKEEVHRELGSPSRGDEDLWEHSHGASCALKSSRIAGFAKMTPKNRAAALVNKHVLTSQEASILTNNIQLITRMNFKHGCSYKDGKIEIHYLISSTCGWAIKCNNAEGLACILDKYSRYGHQVHNNIIRVISRLHSIYPYPLNIMQRAQRFGFIIRSCSRTIALCLLQRLNQNKFDTHLLYAGFGDLELFKAIQYKKYRAREIRDLLVAVGKYSTVGNHQLINYIESLELSIQSKVTV